MQAQILTPGISNPQEIGRHISAAGSMTAAQRLAIYQRGYFARLLSCMRGQFKALHHALGEELFADFVQVYLSEHPSQSPTLSDLGQHFAAYLQASRPDADTPLEQHEPWADFMVDLADYEWQLFLKFDGPGPEHLPQPGAQTPDEALQIQPSLSLHNYRFNVATYCDAVSREQNPEIPAQRSTSLALLRHQYKVGIFRLTPAQHMFLQGVLAGQTLTASLNRAARHFGTSDDQALNYWQTWRSEWLRHGFFCLRTPHSTKP